MPRQRPRKRLPKDLSILLHSCQTEADLEHLKQLLSNCVVDATELGRSRTTALMLSCPPQLAQWLIERGHNIHATDIWGRTPADRTWRGSFVTVLLAAGADVNRPDHSGLVLNRFIVTPVA